MVGSEDVMMWLVVGCEDVVGSGDEMMWLVVGM